MSLTPMQAACFNGYMETNANPTDEQCAQAAEAWWDQVAQHDSLMDLVGSIAADLLPEGIDIESDEAFEMEQAIESRIFEQLGRIHAGLRPWPSNGETIETETPIAWQDANPTQCAGCGAEMRDARIDCAPICNTCFSLINDED